MSVGSGNRLVWGEIYLWSACRVACAFLRLVQGLNVPRTCSVFASVFLAAGENLRQKAPNPSLKIWPFSYHYLLTCLSVYQGFNFNVMLHFSTACIVLMSCCQTLL
jgi:hypothetical protein